ncbi:MAG: F0F1 ATP synthase subunit B [Acidimicrobiales bacterium]
MTATRLMRALLAVLLAGFSLFAFASPASAAESEEDCLIHAVEDYGDDEARLEQEVEACKAAPNPLLPEVNELIWGGLAFLIVFGFLWKMGVPAIKGGMTARADRIRSDLDAAEAQRTEADAILADYRAQLADAKNESARIIEEARQSADALKKDQEARLQTELADLRSKAAADIDAAKVQAIADLRGEVASLAIGAAEVVVGHNLDQPTQVQLIEDYINQVSNQR